MIEIQKNKKIKKFKPKFKHLNKKNIKIVKESLQQNIVSNKDKNYQKISNFKISKPKNSHNYIDINHTTKQKKITQTNNELVDTQQKLLKLNQEDMKQLKQQLNPEDYIIYNRNQIAKQKYGW